MEVDYELITGVALGVENFDDDDFGEAWIISLIIFRIIILFPKDDDSDNGKREYRFLPG